MVKSFHWQKFLVLQFATLALCLLALGAEGDAIPVIIADFDYIDTSGEVADQRAEHAARVKGFAELLRERLASEGRYKILRLDCANVNCSAGRGDPVDLLAAVRKTDAQLLVYGGIHKMSTLIEWGNVYVLDVQQNEVLLNRLFTFRGDTDEAFQRAAKFISELLQGTKPKS
jgi:hypothetical protein